MVQARYKKLSLEEKKRRRATRKAFYAKMQNSFYENATHQRINERIEGAVNRRAAGCYVRNF